VRLKYYPLAVRLKEKLVVVVGGGKVAERKVQALRKAKAFIRLVSPTLTPRLKALYKKGAIDWISRHAQNKDLRDAYIIVAATNEAKNNQTVSRWAKQRKIWINVVDQPALSDFISPARFYAKNAIITVYTDGKDPALSRDIKNFLKGRWDEFLSYRDKLQYSSA